MALTQESVLSFLLERGGKVKNSELLNNFRSLIGGTDPAEKQRNRDLFKKLVNSVAVVQLVDGVKLVVVRKRYRDFVREAARDDASHKTPTDYSFSSPNQNTVFSGSPPPPHPAESQIPPDIENNNTCASSDTRHGSCGDAKLTPAGSAQDGKSLPGDNCSADTTTTTTITTTTTVRVLNLSADQTSRARKPAGAVFAVIAVKSPPRDSSPATRGGSQTQVHQDKSADKLITKASTPSLPNLTSCKKGAQSCWESRQAEDMPPSLLHPSKTSKQADEVKYPADCVPLEPLVHEWLVKCAAGQWGQIHGLLLQDARVAQRKDFMSGFTALHWAAKDGNGEMIRKLVEISTRGGVRLDVNSRAHGGYTPLHIAAIHGRDEAMALLVQSYGARVDERDNDGKKASHYLGQGASAEVRALLGGPRQGKEKEREKGEDEEHRENARGLYIISKLFQPHMHGKKPKTTTKCAHDMARV